MLFIGRSTNFDNLDETFRNRIVSILIYRPSIKSGFNELHDWHLPSGQGDDGLLRTDRGNARREPLRPSRAAPDPVAVVGQCSLRRRIG